MASGALPRAAAPKKRNVGFASACAILASMTSILLGYDIGVMNGASLFIKDDLKITDVEVEILIGIMSLYSLIGSFAAGRTSDWIGRRFTIVFAAFIFFVGALIMGFAVNYAMLMAGRFVAGIGVGYALMIAPVYTAEVSPSSSRGFLTSFPEVFINIGLLLGFVSNYAFARLPLRIGWRLMLGLGAAPSVALAFMVLVMPESPRWLVMKGRLADAKAVLEKTSDTPEEAALRLTDMKAAVGFPTDLDGDVVTLPKRKNGEEGQVWKELILSPSPGVRRVLLSAVGIHFFQLSTGLDCVVLYSPRVFQSAGITDKNQLLGTNCAVGVTKTLFVLVATSLVDRIGRRPLLLSSMGGMFASLVALALGLTVIGHHPGAKIPWAVGLCITSVLSYVAFFSIGMGPITWVYSSEIFPLHLRALGCALAVASNRVTSGVVSMTFLSLSHAITIGGSFFLYAGMAALASVFMFTYLPETRGRTLEEMGKLFGIPTMAAEEADAAGDKKIELTITS